MLRAHASDIATTDLRTGEKLEGRLLQVTSTKEKITLALILTEDGKIHPFYPDMHHVGFTVANIEHLGDVESMQSRENRKAKYEGRKAVKFPPNMGQKSVPVIPVDQQANASDRAEALRS